MNAIDVHAHWYPKRVLELVARYGPAYGVEWTEVESTGPQFRIGHLLTGPLGPRFVDLDARLRAMDEQGVAVQALSFSQPMVDWAPPELAERLQRGFNADAPNRLWVADITYIPTWAGFLFLAVVLEVFSRRIVGWSMAEHLRTELVLSALNLALGQRRASGVVHHSDHGTQYTSTPWPHLADRVRASSFNESRARGYPQGRALGRV